jgi:hypothetical protein
MLATSTDGSMLSLDDENTKAGAMLSVFKGTPLLDLVDENGKPLWSAP